MPGVAPPTANGGGTNNPGKSFQITANGTSRSATNVRIDGVTDTNAWVQFYSTYVPSNEAIQTVNVVTTSPDAEQGLTNGAAVNVQTKSGTNQLHGSLFEYNVNSAFKARPFFLPPTRASPNSSRTISADRSADGSSRTSCSISAATKARSSARPGRIRSACPRRRSAPATCPLVDADLRSQHRQPGRNRPDSVRRQHHSREGSVRSRRNSSRLCRCRISAPPARLPITTTSTLRSRTGCTRSIPSSTGMPARSCGSPGASATSRTTSSRRPFSDDILGGGNSKSQNGNVIATAVTHDLHAESAIRDRRQLGIHQGEPDPRAAVRSIRNSAAIISGIPGVNLGDLPTAGGMPQFQPERLDRLRLRLSVPPLPRSDPAVHGQCDLDQGLAQHPFRRGYQPAAHEPHRDTADLVQLQRRRHVAARRSGHEPVQRVRRFPPGAAAELSEQRADHALDHAAQLAVQPLHPRPVAGQPKADGIVRHALGILSDPDARRSRHRELRFRHQPDSWSAGSRGNPTDCGITVSKRLFSPRIGIAYRPTEKLGDPRRLLAQPGADQRVSRRHLQLSRAPRFRRQRTDHLYSRRARWPPAFPSSRPSTSAAAHCRFRRA